MFGTRWKSKKANADHAAHMTNWAELHFQRELVRRLELAFSEAVTLISNSKNPTAESQYFREKENRVEEDLLAKNKLNYSILGQLSHRFGHMVYREQSSGEECAIYWKWLGPRDDEWTMIGPISDAQGELIDYTSYIEQLEKEKLDIKAIKNKP